MSDNMTASAKSIENHSNIEEYKGWVNKKKSESTDKSIFQEDKTTESKPKKDDQIENDVENEDEEVGLKDIVDLFKDFLNGIFGKEEEEEDLVTV